jgi:hypothetical protein
VMPGSWRLLPLRRHEPGHQRCYSRTGDQPANPLLHDLNLLHEVNTSASLRSEHVACGLSGHRVTNYATVYDNLGHQRVLSMPVLAHSRTPFEGSTWTRAGSVPPVA